MKLFKSIPVTIAVFLTMGMTVFAGNINEHEQRVLDKVSEVVYYHDKEYQVKSSYVERLRAYMNQDNVDLTSSQAESVINQFYANIGRGIKEGYMEEVGGEQPSENDIGKDSSNSNKPTGGSTGGNTYSDSWADDTDGTDAQNDSQTDTTDSTDTQNNSLTTDQSAEAQDGTVTASDDATDGNTAKDESDSGLNRDQNSNDTDNTEETADDQSGLTEEEIARLQKEREFVQRVLEENSMPEEEADVYAELEEAEARTNADKDYSDAIPFKKGINIGLAALIVAVVFVAGMACILWVHKNKHRRKK